jgi:hypothetical protein
MNSDADAPAATKKAGAATSVTANDDHPGSTARASPVSQSVMWCTTIATRASPRSRSSARIRATPDGAWRSGAGAREGELDVVEEDMGCGWRTQPAASQS